MTQKENSSPESALKEIQQSLDLNERNLRSMIGRDEGVVWEHFDPIQGTTLLCIINCVLNLSDDVKKMAGLLDVSNKRPHSGDTQPRQEL